MDMFDFLEATPDEINKGIAARVRTVRKRRKISQVKLSEKSGVSLGSVKRFESTGEISLLSLTKIAIALNVEQELKQLFSNVPYLSLEEIENERNQTRLRYLIMVKLVGYIIRYQRYLTAFAYDPEWLSNGFSISPFCCL